MTADGKIATANRRVATFGSLHDREHMMDLRASVDAVMAGARTVDLAKVNLGPGASRYRRRRLKRGLAEYNLRVIVSRRGTIDTGAEIFRRRFSPIVILTTRSVGARRLRELQRVADKVKVCGEQEINFRSALRWLGRTWAVRRLLCEGGGELNSALFRAGLVDELHLTICPFILGGRDAPTIADGAGASALSGATSLKLHSMQRIGDELFLVWRRADQ